MPDIPRSIPRRAVLLTAFRVAGAGCALVAATSDRAAAQTRQKIAKADAHYRDSPNGQQHCAICAFYVPPVGCSVVRGEVSPNGWCDRFQPRTA